MEGMTFVYDGETQAEENSAITTLCLGGHSAVGLFLPTFPQQLL